MRRLVSEGRVDEAAALLGHHYAIDGHVVRGDQRGRQLGFPTANLQTANELLPPNGVYVTVAIGRRGAARRSPTSASGRRSAAGRPQTIETHVLDYSGDLYDRPVRLAFVQRLREERAFDGVEALARQIEADCGDARVLFQRISL